jgi:ATP-dependent DNA helicase DinG
LTFPPSGIVLTFYKKKMKDYFPGLDVLELFGFLYPTAKVAPSFIAICDFLELPIPVNSYEKLESLKQITECLLQKLQSFPAEEQEQIALIVEKMRGWSWRKILLKVLPLVTEKNFSALKNIDEWQEEAPKGEGTFVPLTEKEVECGLSACLKKLKRNEKRQEQEKYARQASWIFSFAQANEKQEVHAVLAQAGTGVGKTLGYGIPAYLWTQKNDSCVWMSTYTKALQTQLLNELSPLFSKGEIVVRKGRENYLCLLNYMDAMDTGIVSVPLGFVARWLMKTKDGDLRGGDFSGWIMDLFGRSPFLNLTDRRGECLFSACPYYKKCFIEKIVRSCARAKVVIANHALVMTQLSSLPEGKFFSSHYVFDEGHHLFQSADSAFSLELSGQEGLFMFQYIFGARQNTKYLKGLALRVKKLPNGSAFKVQDALLEVLEKASFLPKEGFIKRIKNNRPKGSWETFLQTVYRQVLSQNKMNDEFSKECGVYPATDDVLRAAEILKTDFQLLTAALKSLLNALEEPFSEPLSSSCKKEKKEKTAQISVPEENTEQALRQLEPFEKSVMQRLLQPFEGFIQMLDSLKKEPNTTYVDWFEITKREKEDVDVLFARHFLDPMKPLYEIINKKANGLLITSATLKEKTQDEQEDWKRAQILCGARYLPQPAVNVALPSPFCYQEQAKIFLITDVDKNSPQAVANAFLKLFSSSQGGALGIFTAIHRLRRVYQMIDAPLRQAGIELLAQHVMDMAPATLIDLFKADENACLLGTDTVRDGIDVPGRSLRLIVFDRIPWPRPDILHKARRSLFEKGVYDKMMARQRLTQAFGRLIRNKRDKGFFVLLESALPSELALAFPQEVELCRVSLNEAVRRIKEETDKEGRSIGEAKFSQTF